MKSYMLKAKKSQDQRITVFQLIQSSVLIRERKIIMKSANVIYSFPNVCVADVITCWNLRSNVRSCRAQINRCSISEKWKITIKKLKKHNKSTNVRKSEIAETRDYLMLCQFACASS